MDDLKKELTPKQARFIDEYLIDENGTQAAIRAGYASKNADKLASQLLGNTRVRNEIEKGLKEKKKKIEKRAKRFGITKERWIKELALIAFANMDDFVEVGTNEIRVFASSERNKKLGKAIKKISEHTSQYGGSVSLELHPKLAALELLAKHFGWIQIKIDQKVKDTTDPKLKPKTFVINIGEIKAALEKIRSDY